VYGIAIQPPSSTLASYFSRLHPELRVELLNRMMIPPNLMLHETRIISPGPIDIPLWTEEMRRFPGVERVEIQPEGPGRAICRVSNARSVVEQVVQKHRVLARYPIVIQDGWIRFETLATASQMRPFLQEVGRRVGPHRLESVRRHSVSLGSMGLTPSQDAVFRTALRTGYFSVPRRITVSALAEELGRSKSSTSEMLAKIHQRLAESALQLDLTPAIVEP